MQSTHQMLFRVASKFNVSTSTIVDVLSSKSFLVGDRPTSKISREMLGVLEDYFAMGKGSNNNSEDNVSSHFTKREDSNNDLQSKKEAKHLTINEDDIGIDFQSLFDNYVDKKTNQIIIVDPYIRMHYQIENLMHFLDYLRKTVKNKNNLNIRLITFNKKDFKELTIERLKKISDDLNRFGINFTYKLDDSIHDRFVKVDDKWKIMMGRGLDIYKESKLTEISHYDLKMRKCRGFNITYLPEGSF
jgi:ATP-dependent Lon protease